MPRPVQSTSLQMSSRKRNKRSWRPEYDDKGYPRVTVRPGEGGGGGSNDVEEVPSRGEGKYGTCILLEFLQCIPIPRVGDDLYQLASSIPHREQPPGTSKVDAATLHTPSELNTYGATKEGTNYEQLLGSVWEVRATQTPTNITATATPPPPFITTGSCRCWCCLHPQVAARRASRGSTHLVSKRRVQVLQGRLGRRRALLQERQAQLALRRRGEDLPQAPQLRHRQVDPAREAVDVADQV